MTSLTSRLLLGIALPVALLGGCNKRPADQPPTPSVTTPATPSDTTTPAPAPAATPPAQNSSAPPPTTNQ